jgi:hypothetical protein
MNFKPCHRALSPSFQGQPDRSIPVKGIEMELAAAGTDFKR